MSNLKIKLKRGQKYVPHSKSIGSSFENSLHIEMAKQRNQPYLFYVGKERGEELYVFSADENSKDGDFFLPSDVTPFKEN